MPDIDSALEQAGLAHSPLHRFLGFEFLPPQPGAGYVDVRMPFRDEQRRQDGEDMLHGGVLMTLIDVAGVWALQQAGAPSGPTVDLRVDFMRPAVTETHVARAWIIRRGRSFAWTDVRVTDEHDRLVAVGRGLYSVAPEHAPKPIASELGGSAPASD